MDKADRRIQRITGPQLFRACLAAGGVWTTQDMADVFEVNRVTILKWRRTQGFPPAVFQVVTGPYPQNFYAGEDVLTWLESTDRFARARRFADAIARIRLTSTYGKPIATPHKRGGSGGATRSRKTEGERGSDSPDEPQAPDQGGQGEGGGSPAGYAARSGDDDGGGPAASSGTLGDAPGAEVPAPPSRPSPSHP